MLRSAYSMSRPIYNGCASVVLDKFMHRRDYRTSYHWDGAIGKCLVGGRASAWARKVFFAKVMEVNFVAVLTRTSKLLSHNSAHFNFAE